ncbi:hypothetical protein BPOR_0208g00130 [Botrytis porri]|uniref:Uncharacterized protein n=1 Tax=Botrytis porri TaxID=87229 RepID=A0A4Z1KTL2_9HELO|nr:hypothetical protein BPOR_0208g00130 [Botrytis porri]
MNKKEIRGARESFRVRDHPMDQQRPVLLQGSISCLYEALEDSFSFRDGGVDVLKFFWEGGFTVVVVRCYLSTVRWETLIVHANIMLYSVYLAVVQSAQWMQLAIDVVSFAISTNRIQNEVLVYQSSGTGFVAKLIRTV